jgi:menaquinone-dependent protoporphyrinogen oxidase
VPLIELVSPLLVPLGKMVETSFDFYYDEKCAACGICEMVCLAEKVLVVDGRPVWQEGVDCHGCFACLNFCPEESIQVESRWYLKSHTDQNGRYHHPEITVQDIAGQKTIRSMDWPASLLDDRRTQNKREVKVDNKVLVAYATKYGATAEIAEKIGEVLRQAGLATDVVPADRAGDVGAYQAVVLGSAVYIGQWRKEAAKFLQANESALAEKPVWLFSSGPTGEGDVAELMQGWRFPGKLQPIADRIGARDIAVFHGTVDADKLNFLERWMLKNVKAPAGDYRDWETIIAWATAIAEELQGTVAG